MPQPPILTKIYLLNIYNLSDGIRITGKVKVKCEKRKKYIACLVLYYSFAKVYHLIGWGRGTHILRHTGAYRSNGSLFHTKNP